jgi:hypothetical protein
MRRRSRSFGLRVPVAGGSAIFGALGSRGAGPGAMTPFYLLLSEEMTFIVRRPCSSGKSRCAQSQGVGISLRIDETANLSSCFRRRKRKGGRKRTYTATLRHRSGRARGYGDAERRGKRRFGKDKREMQKKPFGELRVILDTNGSRRSGHNIRHNRVNLEKRGTSRERLGG